MIDAVLFVIITVLPRNLVSHLEEETVTLDVGVNGNMSRVFLERERNANLGEMKS
jgi:hypothetical protein